MFFLVFFRIYGRMTLRCETWSSSLHPHKFKENPCATLSSSWIASIAVGESRIFDEVSSDSWKERKKNITFKLRPRWQSFIKLRSEATDKNLNQISWKFAYISHRIPHKTNNSLKKRLKEFETMEVLKSCQRFAYKSTIVSRDL